GDITFGGPFGVIDAPEVKSAFFTLLPTRLALIQMDDFSGSPPTALSSSNLPLVPPDLSLFTGQFSSVGWNLEFQASDFSAFGRARGDIQSFTVTTQVSEASGLSIFAAGIAALVGLAWGSRRFRAS